MLPGLAGQMGPGPKERRGLSAMRDFIVVLTMILALTACASTQVTFRHPVTGAEARCGPYDYAISSYSEIIARQKQAECVEEYRRQGYERTSPPP